MIPEVSADTLFDLTLAPENFLLTPAGPATRHPRLVVIAEASRHHPGIDTKSDCPHPPSS